MNLPFGRPFRLVRRGEPGLSCDEIGVALGGIALVRLADGGRQAEVRPLADVGEVLMLAYGAQSPEVVQRCHRGLKRAAAQLEAGDLALASLEAVMIGFPDIAPTDMAKLAALAKLEKAGTAWQDQPRIPAGEHGGGQWTTDGGTRLDHSSKPAWRAGRLFDPEAGR